MQVKPENVFLSKITMTSSHVGYKGRQVVLNGDYPHTKTIGDTEDKIPLPEFEIQFKGMAKYAALVMEDIELVDLLMPCKCSEDVRLLLMPSLEETRSLIIGRYTVDKVEFTGSDLESGVVLSGSKKTAKGKEVNFKTPAINFTSQLYGFEESIKIDCEELKDLAFNYIYKNEHAEPTLKNPDGSTFGMPEETGDEN